MAPTYNFVAETVIAQGRVPRDVFEELREWHKTQKLPVLSNEQLVLFLLSCSNKLEATQKTIHAHFKCKSSAPELFTGRDIGSADLQRALTFSSASLFPVRTPSNDAILYWRLLEGVPYYRFHLESAIKLPIVVGELPLYEDPPDGVVVIIDLRGLGLMHITKLRISPLRKFFQFVQEGYSCKIKHIHVLNTVYFIDKVMLILKPLMSKELYNAIKFHSTSMKMEHFFQTYLSADCMPADYGGKLADQATLCAQTCNALRGLGKFYQDEDEQIRAYKSMH